MTLTNSELDPAQSSELRRTLLEFDNAVQETDADHLKRFQEAEAKLEAHLNKKIVEALDRVQQSINQHTVPEGKHLVTRQYVENTIEFEKNRIKER